MLIPSGGQGRSPPSSTESGHCRHSIPCACHLCRILLVIDVPIIARASRRAGKPLFTRRVVSTFGTEHAYVYATVPIEIELVEAATLQKILTEAWLCDPEVLDEIEDFAACLFKVARDGDMTIPSGSELVLELEANLTDNAQTKNYWTYYFVNHAERVLFWLHEYDVCDELETLRRIQSASHISMSFSLPQAAE